MAQRRINIVYTIAGTYRPAGMERILTDKANWLAAHGYKVTVISTEQKGRPDAFALDPDITRIDLAIGYEDNNGASFRSKLLSYPKKKIRHFSRLRMVLRQIRPDVTVSMFCGDETFLPHIKDGSRKLLEVHFSRYKRLQYARKGFWHIADALRSKMDYRVVRRFDRFVVLTEEDLGYWGRPANGTVIPNFLDGIPAEPSRLDGKTVLGVGRFSYQKSFDRLISAWKLACDRMGGSGGWQLRLIGGGEQKECLAKQVVDSNLTDSVTIEDPTSDMDGVYRDASVLALTSHYEGLPMVMLEAQAYGLPIVSFDCKCGPRDVISDGRDGFLVSDGDMTAFADRLVRLIKDDALLKRMGEKSRASSNRWDREKIMSLWVELIDSIL